MRNLTVMLLMVLSLTSRGQKHTISGYIKDQSSGESLIGASIINLKTQQGTTTNNYGFFSLTQVSDSVELRISYIGYENQVIKLFLDRDIKLPIELVAGTQLKEVEIIGTAEDQIQESTQMSSIDVSIEQIKAMPALLGEVDVFKVLQLLPGVNGGTEGSSGLYVRGGGPDQNLILLDGVPVYNASHLFGFFSVFNADAINHVELIKGGFPARYGGRLSSVIDINMKEGNAKEFKGEGSIGLIASRLTLEGPIKKDRTSFIISGRRTYADLLAQPFMSKNANGGYYFYDLNLKINHKFNDKNRLYLSSYLGDDKARFHESKTRKFKDEYGDPKRKSFEENYGLKWGNITTALRWNSTLSNKLFSNVTATYSRYRFNVFNDTYSKLVSSEDTITNYGRIDYGSGIRDYAIKLNFDYLPHPNHYVKFGANATDHLFTSGVINLQQTEVIDTLIGPKPIRAQEYFAYVEDDFRISDKLKVNLGVHASAFYISKKLYRSIQPRVAGRYLLTKDISLKASYAQMTQFIHLLTNAGLGLPTDLWVPATPSNGPERSWISAIGGAYNLNNKYEISIEGYYKKMSGLIEYKDGATYLNLESDWQTKVESGRGESYGVELFLHKKLGKINGWVGYTLSKTNRTFLNLNDGKTFPYKYDRRHDLEIVGTYDLRMNKSFSLAWVYATGNAITIPQSRYLQYQEGGTVGGQSFLYYDGRNSFRMRDYHRLDLSYTITKKKKWGERSWIFSAYNSYSRRNPFFMDIETDIHGKKRAVQYSLFPIIPSVSYRFKF